MSLEPAPDPEGMVGFFHSMKITRNFQKITESEGFGGNHLAMVGQLKVANSICARV